MRSRLPQRAIIVAGLPGSGKTTITRLLTKKGFVAVSAGEVVRDYGSLSRQNSSRNKLQELGSEILRSGGAGFLGQLLLTASRGLRCVVFDGIRPPQVVSWLARQLPHLLVIYVDAPRSLLLERIRVRDKLTLVAARAVLDAPIEQSVRRVKLISRVQLWNDASIEDLNSQLDRALEAWHKSNVRS